MPHDLRRLPLALWGPRCRGAQVSHSRRHHRQFLCLRSGKRRCTEAERKTKCMCVRASVTDAHGGHSKQSLFVPTYASSFAVLGSATPQSGNFLHGRSGQRENRDKEGKRRQTIRPHILYTHRRGAPHCRTASRLCPPQIFLEQGSCWHGMKRSMVRTLQSSSPAPLPLFPA